MLKEEVKLKKVRVNQAACIKCGACYGCIDLVHFDSDDEGLSIVINDNGEEDTDKAIEAMEACPTNAISIEEETGN